MNTEVVQSFDPVISLIEAKNTQHRTQKIFAIIPRRNSTAPFFMHAHWRAKQFGAADVRILSMQPDDPEDQRSCLLLADELRMRTTVHPVRTLQELIDALLPVSAVLSQRYHGALAALMLGIPMEVWHQEEGDKLSTLRDLEKADPKELIALVHVGEGALRSALVSTTT
jgi:polysaccharide pyruvyl transferase WcaK-like protein